LVLVGVSLVSRKMSNDSIQTRTFFRAYFLDMETIKIALHIPLEWLSRLAE